MILPTISLLLVSLLIGLYSSRRIQGSVRNYFVAGNVIPFWVLVFSISGQAIELGGTHDNAELAMSGHFWDGAVLPVGIGLSLILIGLFFAKPLHRLRLLTLPDFYAKRYSPYLGTLVAGACVFSFVILIAGNLAAMGMLLNLATGVSPTVAVPTVGLIVMAYTMAGGLFAVTWNDVLQVGVAIVGFVVALVWLVVHYNFTVVEVAFSTNFSWAPVLEYDSGALRVWATLLALAFGDIVALDFMERVFASGSERGARWACVTSGVVTILVGVCLAVIGMIAGVVGPMGEHATFLQFVDTTFPPGIKMLFVMGLLGAGISTIDGAIMACAVTISRNVVGTVWPSLIPPERLLWTSRCMAIPVTIASVVLAIVFPVPAELLVLAFDIVLSGCLVPLVFGIYWKRGTARAAAAAIIIPSILRLALHFVFDDLITDPRLNGLQTLVPPIISLALFVSVSLVWPSSPPMAPLEKKVIPA